MQSSEFPFRIIVVADLSGTPEVQLPVLRDRRLITLTRQHFAEIMRAQRPRVVLKTKGFVKSSVVEFRDLQDFGADQVAARAAAQGASESEVQVIAMTAVSDPIFAAVCSAWHGIDLLLRATQSNTEIVVQCLNISKRELLKDLQRAPEFDQSTLFRHVYSEWIGTFGGGAAGCVLADYTLTGHPNDIELAERFSNIAAVAGCPVLFGASPQICHIESWKDLNPDFDPAWFTRFTDTAKLQSFRQSDDADFVFAAFPMFRPREERGLPTGIWINSIYLAACSMANAFRGDTFDKEAWAIPGADSTEFESDIPDYLSDRLRLIGLNAFSHRDLIGSIASMQSINFPNRNTGGLSALLSDCRIWQRLYLALRRRGTWSDVADIPHDLRKWLRAAPESRIEKGTRYEIGQSGPRLVLRIHHSLQRPTSRTEFPLCLASASPEQEMALRPRLLFLADFHRGMILGNQRRQLEDRKAVTINCENFDQVLKAWCQDSALELTIGNVLNEGTWIKTELHFEELDDFDPESLALQIRICKDLLQDRTQLVDVAAVAESHRDRWARLQEASARGGGLRGLALKLEGWASGVRDDELFPFPIANLSEEIGPWAEIALLNVEGRIPRLKDALLRYQAHVDAGGKNCLQEPERLCATLYEIDNIISAQLRPILESETFSRLESLWRGLRRLVCGSAEVSAFNMGPAQSALESRGASAHILRILSGLLRPISGQGNSVTFFVMDYTFDELTKLERLPRILDLSARKNFFVVCNVISQAVDKALGDIVLTDPTLQRMIGGRSAQKLILVAEQKVGRTEHMAKHEHPSEFVFNRKGPPLSPLFGSNIYRVAAVFAEITGRLLAASTVEERCQSVRGALNDCGLDCRPLGGAMFIWSTEEA
jgi:type VI secretion system ImpB/VipA family protein